MFSCYLSLFHIEQVALHFKFLATLHQILKTHFPERQNTFLVYKVLLASFPPCLSEFNEISTSYKHGL